MDFDAFFNIASNNTDTFVNSIENDLLIFTENSNQRVLIGVSQNSHASIVISSNLTLFNTGMDVMGTITQYGSPILQNFASQCNNIYVLNSNVGIGLSNPSSLLSLYDSNTINPSNSLITFSSATSAPAYVGLSSNANLLIWHTSNNAIEFGINNQEMMVLTENGLGINRSNPSYTLDVGGSINLTGVLYQNGVLYTPSNFFTANNDTVYLMHSNLGIGTCNAESLLHLNAINNIPVLVGFTNSISDIGFIGMNSNGDLTITHTSSNHDIQFTTSNNEVMRITSYGNVGINTTIPNSELQVVGTITACNIIVDYQTSLSNVSIIGTLTASNPVFFQSNVNIGGILTVNNIEYITSNITVINSETVQSNLTVQNNAIVNGMLTVMSNSIFESPVTLSNVTGTLLHVFDSNVGIGTLNPQSKLDINGSANIASNLNFNGILTRNNVPYIQSQLSNNGSNVFLLSSNFGLGTSNPLAQLHLTQNLQVDGSFSITNAVQFRGVELIPGQGAKNTTQVYALTCNIQGFSNNAYGASNGLTFSLPTSTCNDVFNFVAGMNSNYALQIAGNGSLNVFGNIIPYSNSVYDIGSSNSCFRDLYLSGNTLVIGGTKFSTNIAGSVEISDVMTGCNQSLIVNQLQVGSTSNSITIAYDSNAGQITYSTISNGVQTMGVSGGSGWSNNRSNVFILSPSNVGIGKSNPGYALDVVGDVNFTGILRQNGNNSIQFGGVEVVPGNVTSSAQIMTSTVQGYSNMMYGNSGSNGTMFSIMSNTSNDSFRFVSGSSSNDIFRITGTGYVGIGTTSPLYTLDVTGNARTTGTLTQNSDERFKTDLKVIDNAMSRVSQLTGFTYSRIDDTTEKRHTGVIAQELERVLPEAVLTDEDGIKSVAYGNLAGLFIEAIKELHQAYEVLLTKINKIESKQ